MLTIPTPPIGAGQRLSKCSTLLTGAFSPLAAPLPLGINWSRARGMSSRAVAAPMVTVGARWRAWPRWPLFAGRRPPLCKCSKTSSLAPWMGCKMHGATVGPWRPLGCPWRGRNPSLSWWTLPPLRRCSKAVMMCSHLRAPIASFAPCPMMRAGPRPWGMCSPSSSSGLAASWSMTAASSALAHGQ